MPLKVIGAGMGRTGTASLKVALEQLGLGRCYHMSEILQNPEYIPDWMDAANGNPDWDRIYNGYAATMDNPGCQFWRELAQHYPQAKVILTVRDPERWFESTNETIHSEEFARAIKNTPWGEMVHKTVYDAMDNRMQDKAFMVSFFKNRTREIINTISPERLLVYEVKQGWEPLCDFLDVAVPETEFPRVNSRDETKALLAGMTGEDGNNLSDESMTEAASKLHAKDPG